MVVVKVTGHAILSALENGVSTYPALEGRFPQVSGIKYAFDPNLPPGKRVLRVTTGDDKAIDLDKTYILSTRDYMCRGKGMSESDGCLHQDADIARWIHFVTVCRSRRNS